MNGRGLRRAAVAVVLAVSAAVAGAQELFPEPFAITHQLVHTQDGATVLRSPPVTDSYGGSWVVSEREDGSRLVVDLARRELTEIRPEAGTYWRISFDRLAELVRRLDRAERGPRDLSAAEASSPPDLRVVEAEHDERAARTVSPVVHRRGARKVRVLRAEREVLEAWVDPELRMTPEAVAALGELERTVLSPGGGPAAQAVDAVRRSSGGFVPVATRRPLRVEGEAEPVGTIADVALEVTRLQRFPAEMVTVPDGLRSVPHPMELMVAHAEREAELRRATAGSGR